MAAHMVRIPSGLYGQLEALAEEQRRSVTNLVEVLLAEALILKEAILPAPAEPTYDSEGNLM